MANVRKPLVLGLRNAMLLLCAFAPVILSEVLTLRLITFGAANVFCSAAAAWGLSSRNGWKFLMLFVAFCFVNATVGLAHGCTAM